MITSGFSISFYLKPFVPCQCFGVIILKLFDVSKDTDRNFSLGNVIKIRGCTSITSSPLGGGGDTPKDDTLMTDDRGGRGGFYHEVLEGA